MKRVKDGEIVVYPTDKSGKLAVTTWRPIRNKEMSTPRETVLWTGSK